MELINSNLVRLDLDAKDAQSVITKMAETLFEAGRISDKELFLDDLFQREKEVSTSMGMDLALPHARSKSVKYSSLFFAHLHAPIVWGADMVKIIVGIAVPEENNETNSMYLKMLSSLARKLMHDEFREALMQADNPQQCVELLSSIEEETA